MWRSVTGASSITSFYQFAHHHNATKPKNFSLCVSVSEGFLKVTYASHVPLSVHPARKLPLAV